MSDHEYDYEFSDRDADVSEHSDDRSSAQESDFEYGESDRKDSDRRDSDRSDHRARYEEDGTEGFDVEVSDQLLEPSLQMCSKHRPGSMIEGCKVCSAALAMVA